MIPHARTGGSGSSGTGRSRGDGRAASRELVLGDSGRVVLVLEVPRVGVYPAAVGVGARGVPLDGDAQLVGEAGGLARVERRDALVVVAADRVGADERPPWHALSRRRQRRR